MIQPTVGRHVHFYENPGYPPQAAVITQVFNDRLVNLAVFTYDGDTRPAREVTLHQPDDEAPMPYPGACWMPYQLQSYPKGCEDSEAESNEDEDENTSV